MTSTGRRVFVRHVILPLLLILLLGLAAALYRTSSIETWSYLIKVEGDPSHESLQRLPELLARRVRLFPSYFHVGRAAVGVLEDGSYVVSARSRSEPLDFISALVNPNVVELREAINAAEGAEPPEGFRDSVLPIPEYKLEDISDFTIRERPIFLSESPGMLVREVKSVKVWLTKTLTRDPVISIEFADNDAAAFAELTGRIADADGGMLALLVDGELKTAGVVEKKIEGGRAELRAVPTKEQARFLSAIIEAGSLPSDLRLRAEKQETPEASDEAQIQ